jgi:hypothetical protein
LDDLHGRQPQSLRITRLRPRLARIKEPPQRIAFIQAMLAPDTEYYGKYSQWLADEYLKLGDVANFEAVLKAARTKQSERPLKYADWDLWQVGTWFDTVRANTMLKPEDKVRYLTAIRDAQVYPASASAALALMEDAPINPAAKMQRLLELQRMTRIVGNEWYDWDRLAPFAQTAVGKKDYVSATVRHRHARQRAQRR